jgi:hypothetical protein
MAVLAAAPATITPTIPGFHAGSAILWPATTSQILLLRSSGLLYFMIHGHRHTVTAAKTSSTTGS